MMNRLLGKPRSLFMVVLLLALLAGNFFASAPLPDISIAAEKLGQFFGFSVTNTIVAVWFTILLLLGLSYAATRNMKLVPTGIQNFLEFLLDTLLGLVEFVAGKKNGRRFFPLVASLFLFVLFTNWQTIVPGVGTIGIVERAEAGHSFVMNEVQLGGLRVAYIPFGQQKATEGESLHSEETSVLRGKFLPLLRTGTTDLNLTLALAIVAVILIEYFGLSTLGPIHYIGKFVNIKQLRKGNILFGIMDLFVGAIEALSEMVRIISFSFRLFGNMFAGEILIAVMTFLVAWLGPVMFYGLELFIGFIQALIFSMLTLVFATVAAASHVKEG